MDCKKHQENDIFTEDKMAVGNLDSVRNNLSVRYEKYRGIIKNFTFMSDTFMRKVFQKRECVEYVLQVITEKPDLKVTEHVIQKDYKNLQGRSAILDCVAMDSESRMYNMEIQQQDEDASPQRARYHSGLMDMNMLEAGKDFEDLPESYMIFITRGDALKNCLPIAHIRRRIDETGKVFEDAACVIYVNSSIREDTKLGRLMHDFHCKDAKDMYSPVLADRVRELKETQEGVESMCREMEKLYNEGMAQGILLGEKRGIEIGERNGELRAKRSLAFALNQSGMSLEQMALLFNEKPGVIRQWLLEGTPEK